MGLTGKSIKNTRIRRHLPDLTSWQRAGLFLAFLLPFTIMLVLFMVNGIYPFGGRSFLFSDMYHQYMPFFSEFIHKIKAGEGLSYSYNVGIGSNFLALYVYYLSSPLHLLMFLFPEAYLMEFMSYLVIIKIGLCGLTSAVYLRKRFQTKDLSVLIFSTIYALSGFMAAYNWNIMWLDCVILLPLILLGLERLVKEGRCLLYLVTLGLSIFTNYYLSIMICIFLVLYFVVLLLTEKRSIKIIRNFVLYSLLAGGLAAVLLVPEVCALIKTDFGEMNFPETVKSYFSVLDMLARHMMCIPAERGLDHWPNIYSGVITFLLIPMYAMNQRIPIRKRFAQLALAGVLLLGFSTNILDYIWHGMNYPDSLPARQSFIYIFLILNMCFEAFRYLDDMEGRHILYGYLISVGFLLFSEKFIEKEDFVLGIELLNLLFITLYAVLLYLYRTRIRADYRNFIIALLLIVTVAETGINTYSTSVGTVSRTSYLGQQNDYKALLAQIAEEETEEVFYRIEKFTRKTKNDGTLTGYPTASTFSSTLNSDVAKLYQNWGMRYSKVYYCFDGATALTSALLNVRYMFGEDDKEDNSLFNLTGNSGDIYLYQNNYTLPFGYVAPEGYDVPEGFYNEPLKLQNRMVSELGIREELFTKVSGTQQDDDVKLTVEQDGYYYALVTNSGTKMINASSDNYTREFDDLKKGVIIYLGYHEAGDVVMLTNGSEEDETPLITLNFYVMNEAVLEQALEVLSKQHLTNVVYDSTSLSGDIEMNRTGRLILSIPYEAGWSVLVDGEETKPALVGGTLMAFDLEAGYHTIQLNYVPQGKYAGILISVVCVGIFVLVVWRVRRKDH